MHACQIHNKKTKLYCWGSNKFHENSIPTHTTKKQGIEAVVTGSLHTLTVDSTGNMRCYGSNLYGQCDIIDALHSNQTTNNNNNQSAGDTVAIVRSFAAGFGHSCAVWVYDTLTSESLPNGASKPNFVEQQFRHNASDECEYSHNVNKQNDISCELKPQTQMACWGMNRDAQITLPWKHNVELTKEDMDKLEEQMKQMGYDNFDFGKHSVQSQVKNVADASDNSSINSINNIKDNISHTTPHSINPPSTSSLAHNNKSMHATVNRSQPILSDLRVYSVSTGSQHTCIVITDGFVMCFGLNSCGQANPPHDSCHGGCISISANGLTNCAMNVAHRLTCWGDNSHGQLDLQKGAQGRVQMFQNVTVGHRHICAITIAGEQICAGHLNHRIQDMKNGDSIDNYNVVSMDRFVKNVFNDQKNQNYQSDIAAGIDFTCFDYGYNKIFCTGKNSDVIGNIPTEINF